MRVCFWSNKAKYSKNNNYYDKKFLNYNFGTLKCNVI